MNEAGMRNNSGAGHVSVNAPVAGDATGLASELWCSAGGDPAAVERLSFSGEPLLPTVFRVSELAQTTIGAAGLAISEAERLLRSGEGQRVSVDARHAEIAFLSERYLSVDREWPDHTSPTWGYYNTADDRWVQIHTTFPHHQAGAAALLDATPERPAFEAAIGRWDGAAFEQAMADAGLPCTLMRTRDEWLAHPQGAAVAAAPLLDITKIGEADPMPPEAGERALSGLRVLDLTRVIAGPVCGRALAEHGASVMRVASPHLPFVPTLVIDSGRGKLSTHLDLTTAADQRQFEALLEDTQLMVQGYRPGAVSGLGYPPEKAAAIRPGIVYVSLCAFSHEGPWAGRRGFDSLVQVASGIADAGRRAVGADKPSPLPCQALDHATGYLAAFGAMMALMRQWREGGSWHVRVSLAQTAEWLQRLGHVDRMDGRTPAREEVVDLLDAMDSPFGRTRFVRPAAVFSEREGYWATPPVPLGTHAAVWPGV